MAKAEGNRSTQLKANKVKGVKVAPKKVEAAKPALKSAAKKKNK